MLLCIPAHNEAGIIKSSVDIVASTLAGASFAWHIHVVDNGSTDGTASCVANAPNVSVQSIPKKGKGIGVVTAVWHALEIEVPYFGFIDADLSAEPRHVLEFHKLLVNHETDIVIGSRLLDTTRVKRGMLRTASSELFNFFRQLLLGVTVRDSQCGLKVMNARGAHILAQCGESGWFFDMEFLARAQAANLRITEMPVMWDEHRFYGRKSKLRMVRDGFAGIFAMWRIRRLISKQKKYKAL